LLWTKKGFVVVVVVVALGYSGRESQRNSPLAWRLVGLAGYVSNAIAIYAKGELPCHSE